MRVALLHCVLERPRTFCHGFPIGGFTKRQLRQPTSVNVCSVTARQPQPADPLQSSSKRRAIVLAAFERRRDHVVRSPQRDACASVSDSRHNASSTGHRELNSPGLHPGRGIYGAGWIVSWIVASSDLWVLRDHCDLQKAVASVKTFARRGGVRHLGESIGRSAEGGK